MDYEIKHGESEIYLDYIKDELEKVERKITPTERREEQEHEKCLREYREAHEPYIRRVRLWEAEVEKVEKQREAEANRDEAVRRTYRKVKRAFEGTRVSGPRRIGTLPFEIAPPGERTNDHVYAYYREVLRRGQLAEFDQERLDKILTLPRSGLLKGKVGFYGYIVLQFDHTEKVLLECPVYGKALYVLESGEERLLAMNKQELIASDEAKRIFHTKNWYQRVKQELAIK